MTGDSSWHDRARRLLDSGMTITDVAKAIGRDTKRIRVALNLNGAGDRDRAYRRVYERNERAERSCWKDLVPPSRSAPSGQDEPQPATPALRRPTLPKISMPALPDEPVVRRIAPRTRFTPVSPGSAGLSRKRPLASHPSRDDPRRQAA